MQIENELKKQIKALNGDGTRQDRYKAADRVRKAARDMSTLDIPSRFSEALRMHGRAVVALAVAATVDARRDRLFKKTVEWADAILDCWSNRPASLLDFVINDGLHPSKIEIYAKLFIDSTIID